MSIFLSGNSNRLGHGEKASNRFTVRELVERIADEYNRRDLLRFGSRPENQIDPKVIVGIKT